MDKDGMTDSGKSAGTEDEEAGRARVNTALEDLFVSAEGLIPTRPDISGAALHVVAIVASKEPDPVVMKMYMDRVVQMYARLATAGADAFFEDLFREISRGGAHVPRMLSGLVSSFMGQKIGIPTRMADMPIFEEFFEQFVELSSRS